MTFVAGGKYTTYRLMAEQTVNEALRHFPLDQQVRYATSQTLQPLNPLVSPILLERARRECGAWSELPEALNALIADRHGLEGPRILADGPQRTNPLERLWCAEAVHAVRNTMCLHLADFYQRRTPLVLSRRDHGLCVCDAVADTMATLLGWTSARRQEEINALQKKISWDLASVT
jgi:glycerol-3-phosphate dehydrogenase